MSQNNSSVREVFDLQKRHQMRVRGRGAQERTAILRRLKQEIFARRSDLEKALWDDLRKPAAEAGLNEIFPVTGEIKHAEKHLKKWMRPVRLKNPLSYPGAHGSIIYEPRGVVLILAPWN